MAVATFALSIVPVPAAAQGNRGWISILRPAEWNGEVTRGIGVRRRSSVRVEGVARQPGGVERVLIDGRPAQLRARNTDEVRFVGYAETGSGDGIVEVAAYGRSSPAVVRTYRYETDPSLDERDDPWTEERGFTGTRYAVVIGVSEYRDERIGSLRYADDDAEAFYDFLLSEKAGMGGFDPEHVRLLLDDEADTRSVRTALTTFLRQVTENDIVIIYIAGHGAPDPSRPSDYYLLTHDTEADNFAGTAVSMADVNAYVANLRARDVLVFTDACHSAALSLGPVGVRSGPSNAINDLFLDRLTTSAAGLLTFTASETNQYSQEGSQWGGGHGVFTYQLLRGLEGAADEDGDGIVALGEVLEFTRSEVRRSTNGAQVPHIGAGSFDRSWPIAITDVVAERPVPAPDAPRPDLESPRLEVDLLSPGGVFAHSLLIPGSGQLRTGREWRGVVVLGGALGAAAYGYFSTSVSQTCREALVDGVCLSGEYTRSETQRPHLVPALLVAGGLTLLGAIDGFAGARSENDRRQAAGLAGTEAQVEWLPRTRVRGSRSTDLDVVRITFR
ncbi:MAG: caspase family protein [Halobacteriales archaeon]|nr:caspase family protein [Halobacteriales archaeon]